MTTSYVLGLDAGTTGITAIAYDADLRPRCRAYSEIAQHYPQPGWVEHDPAEICAVAQRLLREVGQAVEGRVAAVGITNQRETVAAVRRSDGRPVGRAIVWQCRRTTDRCRALRAQGHETGIRERTGLLLDPYFSATKMRWLLDHEPTVARLAEENDLALVTIDALLVSALTQGRSLGTDVTNASRTSLFDIDSRGWDEGLAKLFDVPISFLPPVRSSVDVFGETEPSAVGFRAPISGVAGDQQAALCGHGCFEPGSAKNTYGTGCFLLMNVGTKRPEAQKGILTTLGVGDDGNPVYVLEGSVFVAGAVLQWLRDELGLIEDASESERLARSVDDNGGVYLVPAFAGLGAPYWDPEARGLICGLTRGSTRAHLVRAALESLAYQVQDLYGSLIGSSGHSISELRVDGGAARNDWLMEFQAGLLGVPVVRGKDLEVTCRGAALLAAKGAGLLPRGSLPAALQEDREQFAPTLSSEERERLLSGWARAVERTR